MLEIEMAHHIPFTPKNEDKRMANGILAEVNTIETMLGGMVFPKPLKAPCVAISRHIKS